MRNMMFILGSLVALTLGASTATASSAVFNTLWEVNMVKVDDQTISLSYGMSGGCEEHTAKVMIQGLNSLSGANPLSFGVIDVTDALDTCEALISNEVQIKFDFAQITELESGELFLNFIHGGCPTYDVSREGDVITVSKVTDECRALIGVEAPLSAKPLELY